MNELEFQLPAGYTVRRIEELDTLISYIGYSRLGEATSSDNWIIKKLDESTAIFSLEYAEGSWDNRTTLNYK